MPHARRGIADNQVDAYRMSLGEHLDELRSCLIRALVGLALTTVFALIFAQDVLKFILAPAVKVLQARGEDPQVLAMSPAEPFLLYLQVAFWSGLILAMPWLLYQLWRFVSSGLYARERRFVKHFLPVSAGLFALGVAFMYYIVLPVAINFFVMFSQNIELPNLELNAFERFVLAAPNPPAATQTSTAPPPIIPVVDRDPTEPAEGSMWFNQPRRTLNVQTTAGRMQTRLQPAASERSVSSVYGLQAFVSLFFSMALGFGIAFELPVLVVFLALTGLVSVASMAGARRYVLLGVIIAAAVLTPSADLLSLALMAIPMYALFEAGLRAARSFESRSTHAPDAVS